MVIFNYDNMCFVIIALLLQLWTIASASDFNASEYDEQMSSYQGQSIIIKDAIVYWFFWFYIFLLRPLFQGITPCFSKPNKDRDHYPDWDNGVELDESLRNWCFMIKTLQHF